MSDADFAAIQQAFPALEWQRNPNSAGNAAGVYFWHISGEPGLQWGGCYATSAGSKTDYSATLPECLAALRAAIAAERDSLNRILGEAP